MSMCWYSFSSTTEVFFYRQNIYSHPSGVFHRQYFLLRHFLILQNSRTFPGPVKVICYFPGFPGCMGTLYNYIVWMIHLRTWSRKVHFHAVTWMFGRYRKAGACARTHTETESVTHPFLYLIIQWRLDHFRLLSLQSLHQRFDGRALKHTKKNWSSLVLETPSINVS